MSKCHLFVVMVCVMICVCYGSTITPKKHQQKTLEPPLKQQQHQPLPPTTTSRAQRRWHAASNVVRANVRLKRNTQKKNKLIILAVNDIYKYWPLSDAGQGNIADTPPTVTSMGDMIELDKRSKVCVPDALKQLKGFKIPYGESALLKDSVPANEDESCATFPKKLGGGQNFAWYVAQIEKHNPDAHIFIDVPGDFYSPSYTSTKTDGAHMTAVMTASGVDVCTIGNHEFDLKQAEFEKMVKTTPCPMLAANVMYDTGPNNTNRGRSGVFLADEDMPPTVDFSDAVDEKKFERIAAKQLLPHGLPSFSAFKDKHGTTKRNSDYITIELETAAGPATLCIVGTTDYKKAKGAWIKTTNHVDKAKEVITELEDTNKCTVIVSSSHQDWAHDVLMANKVHEHYGNKKRVLDAVIGGHDHFMVAFPTKFTDDARPGTGPVIAKMGSDFKYISAYTFNLLDMKAYRDGTWKQKHPPVTGLHIFHVDDSAVRAYVDGEVDRQLKDDHFLTTMKQQEPHVYRTLQALASMKYFDEVSGARALRETMSTSGLKGFYDTHSARDGETRAINLIVDYARYYLKGIDVVAFIGASVRGDVTLEGGIPLFNALDFKEECPFPKAALGFTEVTKSNLAAMVANSMNKGKAYLSHYSGLVVIFGVEGGEHEVLYMVHNPNHVGGKNDARLSRGTPKLIYCHPRKRDRRLASACSAADADTSSVLFASVDKRLWTSKGGMEKLWMASEFKKNGRTKLDVADLLFEASKGRHLRTTRSDLVGKLHEISADEAMRLQSPETVAETPFDVEANLASVVWGGEAGTKKNMKDHWYRIKVLGGNPVATTDISTVEDAAAAIIAYVPQKVALKGSKELLEVADEILTRFTPPRFLETYDGDQRHFTSLQGHDVNAFVEEAVEYGFPANERSWLAEFASNAVERSKHRFHNLREMVDSLHPSLHWLHHKHE